MAWKILGRSTVVVKTGNKVRESEADEKSLKAGTCAALCMVKPQVSCDLTSFYQIHRNTSSPQYTWHMIIYKNTNAGTDERLYLNILKPCPRQTELSPVTDKETPWHSPRALSKTNSMCAVQTLSHVQAVEDQKLSSQSSSWIKHCRASCGPGRGGGVLCKGAGAAQATRPEGKRFPVLLHT